MQRGHLHGSHSESDPNTSHHGVFGLFVCLFVFCCLLLGVCLLWVLGCCFFCLFALWGEHTNSTLTPSFPQNIYLRRCIHCQYQTSNASAQCEHLAFPPEGKLQCQLQFKDLVTLFDFNDSSCGT